WRRTSRTRSRDSSPAIPSSAREGMASSRHVDAFVRRLEHAVAHEVDGRDRVTLAYSGGLASTLVAMLARKRSALDCVVAGVDGSHGLPRNDAFALHAPGRGHSAWPPGGVGSHSPSRSGGRRRDPGILRTRNRAAESRLHSIAFVRITKPRQSVR